MGLRAEYRLAYDALPLVEVAQSVPETTLRVDVGQPNQGSLPPFVVEASAAAFDDLEAAFDDAAFVADWSLMHAGEARRRYRLVPATGMTEQLDVADPERLRSLASADTVVEHVTVTGRGWHQERWFADRETFREYWSFWRDTADSVSLERLTRVDGDDEPETPDDGLTTPQREALVTARELGYFEVPRGAELSTVAEALDVSTAACSERLRRAQAALAADVTDPHKKARRG